MNQSIRNKNCLWWPCLLTDQDEMSNLYRGPSIDASYQVSVNLAKRFWKRRFKKIGQSLLYCLVSSKLVASQIRIAHCCHSGVRVTRFLVLCTCFVYRCLSFFLWPLCCLSFFNLPILITPLASSNSS